MTEPIGSEIDPDIQAIAEKVFGFARGGQAAELDAYVDAGVPVNLTNGKGDTLLILAAYHEHLEAVRVLLAHGADVTGSTTTVRPLSAQRLYAKPARSSRLFWMREPTRSWDTRPLSISRASSSWTTCSPCWSSTQPRPEAQLGGGADWALPPSRWVSVGFSLLSGALTKGSPQPPAPGRPSP